MPRSYVNLEPYDPPTPVADGVGTGLAAVLGGIRERRVRDDQERERQYRAQRDKHMDGIADRRLQLDEQRVALLRDNASTKKAGGTSGGGTINLKDARELAIKQAIAQAGSNEYGEKNPIDSNLVDDLTEYIVKYGELPRVGARQEPVAVGPEDTDAESSPSMISELWDSYKNNFGAGVDTISDAISGEDKPDHVDIQAPAAGGGPSGSVTPRGNEITRLSSSGPGGFVEHFQSTQRPAEPEPDHGERLGDRWSAMNTLMNYLGIGNQDDAPQSQQDVLKQQHGNQPEPDTEFIDRAVEIGQTDPEKFKSIMRELKKRSPEEYKATEAAIRKRYANK